MAASSPTRARRRECRHEQPADGQAAPGPAGDLAPARADGGRDRGQPDRRSAAVLFAWAASGRETERRLPEHRAGVGDDPARPGHRRRAGWRRIAADGPYPARRHRGDRAHPVHQRVEVNGSPRDIPLQVFVAAPDDPMRMATFDDQQRSWPPSRRGDLHRTRRAHPAGRGGRRHRDRRDTGRRTRAAAGGRTPCTTPACRPHRRSRPATATCPRRRWPRRAGKPSGPVEDPGRRPGTGDAEPRPRCHRGRRQRRRRSGCSATTAWRSARSRSRAVRASAPVAGRRAARCRCSPAGRPPCCSARSWSRTCSTTCSPSRSRRSAS